jgi:hypothetical protein
VIFGLCLTFTGEPWSSLMSALWLMPWAALLVWVPVTVFACISEKRLRYRREWESLQIN